MGAVTESGPLLAAAGGVLTTVGGVLGAWLKGRSVARASVAASHAKEHAASEETTRAALAHDAAIAPQLLKRIEALEAHVTRLDTAVADCGRRENDLAQKLTEAVARATLAEREVTLQSARADLAEMESNDLRAELAQWRDRSDATD